MKLLVITQYFYPETFRVNALCTELVKRGHDVTVLTGFPQYPQGRIYSGYGFHKEYERVWNGIKVIRLRVLPRGRTPLGLLLNCWSFVHEGKKWVRSCTEHYDAVYVFEVSPVTVGLPAAAYKKKFGAQLFFNVQDLWPENVEVVLGVKNRLVIGVINRIVNHIYEASDKILCASRSFVENIAARGVAREKLVFWPQFCEEPDLSCLRRPGCYDKSFFNIVFAGNLGTAQGLDMLIDAASFLKDAPVRWYLVGDGRAKEHLRRRVTECGLQDNVLFMGKVTEAEANCYVHYADCAYLSFQDNAVFDMTIPAKLQTYLACGTPVLAAAGGESRDIIMENHCGVVCGRDGRDIAQSVRWMLSSRQILHTMGTNARACYEERFTPKRLLDELEALLPQG